MEDTPLTNERKLWRAVLEQAFTDAELAACSEAEAGSLAAAGEGAFEPHERLQARRYLRADSAHERASLDLVCDFADVPLDRVIPWARRRYPAAA